jgi:hypothetical protein
MWKRSNMTLLMEPLQIMDLLAKIDEKREPVIHWESVEKDARLQSIKPEQ